MRKCPECGANLDSGERCDCEREREAPVDEKMKRAATIYHGLKVIELKAEGEKQ